MPGSHSTNFSPIRPCEPIVQLASCLKGVKPSSSIRSVTAAFLSSVTSMSVITPTGDAGDLHVLAGHERGGVVEDRADEVVRRSCRRRRASRTIPITIHGRIATSRPM